MRPFGTTQQLARRRQRARRLLRQRKNPQQVARKVGATERSVRRWQQQAHTAKPKSAQRRPGRPARLSEEQVEHLKETLHKGALAQGYVEDYWTLARIAQLIRKLFAVPYKPSAVWRLLQRMGWSSQKPQRRSFGGDKEAVVRWRRATWYRVKKVASAPRDPRFSR
ncbi:MAG: winged helix-turn-helix domain-containing protein [Anaerolineae bacterium]